MNTIINDLKLACISKKIPKKIFNIDEIEAIYLLISENTVSKTKMYKYFHVNYQRLDKIIELLEEIEKPVKDDFQRICDIVNN
jgi:hypothetical protein